MSCAYREPTVHKSTSRGTYIDIGTGDQPLEHGQKSTERWVGAQEGSHTAACKEANSMGTLRCRGISGGGLIQSLARPSRVWDGQGMSTGIRGASRDLQTDEKAIGKLQEGRLTKRVRERRLGKCSLF